MTPTPKCLGNSVETSHDEEALTATGIGKQYGPVMALQPFSLTVRAGEIRALVGENGSGKSTVVGILSGTVTPSTGTVEVAGHPLTASRPAAAQQAGMLTVFQDGSLLPSLTVAQNLYVGTPRAARPPFREQGRWAREVLAEHLLDLDPMMPVSQLAPGDRQLLEVIRAVNARPQVLLLDESTSALDATGVDCVLDLIITAARDGAAVVFVTHRLTEVFRVADSISVLRDGQDIGTFAASDLDASGVVERMAGTRVELEYPNRVPLNPDSRVVHTARAITGEGFGPVDLDLRAGEIVGIAGADGNGQEGVLRGLAAHGLTGGEVNTAEGVGLTSVRDATAHGVVFVSSDRRTESLFSPLTVRENLVAGSLGTLARGGVVGRARERTAVEQQIGTFGIRVGSPELLPGSLSGGNQQKVAISKAMATSPRVLLIDEPTQGVDVRARLDIYRSLRARADEGNAVVVVSSDASELAGIADRIVVMSRGEIVQELPGLEADEASIISAFAVESHAESGRESTATERSEPAVRERRRHGGGDAVRLALLAVLILSIGGYAALQNPGFLSAISLRNVLLIATPLAAVALAQYFVLLVGGIDVSVGATMALSVVTMSYLVQASAPAGSVLLTLVIVVAAGAVIGGINAALVERLKLSPVIATIATLGIVSGVALSLRPTPGGAIAYPVMQTLTVSIGVLPIGLLVLVLVAVAADLAMRTTGAGLRVRAVGLNGVFADRLGIRSTRLRSLMYVLCGVVAALGGVLLAGQVGVGDASVGSVYTLLSIAAPVLGGASLAGGRGTAIGVILGSALLAILMTLATVLKIDQGANLVFIGAVTLVALAAGVLRTRRRPPSVATGKGTS